jgi:hypothetical protein
VTDCHHMNELDILFQPDKSSSEAHTPTVVYADSKGALLAAQASGVLKDIPLRSPAPAILADIDLEAARAEEHLTPVRIRELESTLLTTAMRCWNELRDEPLLQHADDVALIASRTFITTFQAVLRAAALVREEDFEGRPLVITAQFSTADLNRRFRFGLADILREVPNADVVEIEGEPLMLFSEPAPPAPSLMERFAYAGFDALFYRLGFIFWRYFPFKSPRGELLILRENELLKETAARFLRRGYALRRLSLGGSPVKEVFTDTQIVSKCVARLLEENLKPYLTSAVLKIAARNGGEMAAQSVAEYFRFLSAWRSRLDNGGRGRPKAILSNTLLTPEGTALHRAAIERRIPLVSFQHGITLEISEHTQLYKMVSESSGSDLVIAFNDETVRLNEENPMSKAKTVAVGLPREFRTLRKAPKRNISHPIWYIRTSLYQSNMFRFHRGLSDADLYRSEVGLIDDVFAKLPHGVIYKPYPAIRYLDDDPLFARISESDNLRVYHERLDLRYEIGNCRVLVTAGATSTVSYCLMSDRPTVFINSPNFCPMNTKSVERFKASLFFFDSSELDFHENLRRFLSQPLETMEEKWQEKAVHRAELVENFFSNGETEPGISAANAIENFFLERSLG